MLRILLSLLVLMSGLASAGPEASAYGWSNRPQVAMVAQAGAARVSAHVVAHAREITRPAQPSLIEAASAPLAAPQMVPAVRLRVDRARE
ncbi:hypothetical protein [Novosphingobium umbonatum]|uniref:hypothetical protein n=1 Tax=Novosphingobium umbonatum TaxID=1908524 RepID=UPI0013E3CF93|nr:hypothetical protein [Novosphingobium umbonatum]